MSGSKSNHEHVEIVDEHVAEISSSGADAGSTLRGGGSSLLKTSTVKSAAERRGMSTELGVSLAPEDIRDYVKSTFHQKLPPIEADMVPPTEGSDRDEEGNRVVPTCAFGKINFKKDAKTKYEPPYVCLSNTDDKQHLLDLMTNLWKLREPKLIVSIVGGAKRFHTNQFSKNRIETLFKQGLLDIATTTGAWILTPGSNTGVYKMVGSAVRDHIDSTSSADVHNIVLLGITSWGAVANRGLLANPEGRFPANYPIADVVGEKRRTSPLDPNHSHFILIDDGSRDVFDRESKWRFEFEKLLKEQVLNTAHHPTAAAQDRDAVKIPMVTLLINGGDGSLESCFESLPIGIPLVAIAGSGRAAEVVISIDKLLNSKQQGYVPTDEELIEIYKKAMEAEPDSNAIKYMKEIANHHKYVSVFDSIQPQVITDDIGLDRAVLAALYHREDLDIGKRKAQMRLALAWNRADFARDEILNINNPDYQEFMREKDFLFEIAFEALLKDSHELFSLLVDHGLDLKEFITEARLKDLYDESMHNDGAYARYIKSLFENQEFTSQFSCQCRKDYSVHPSTPDEIYLFRVGRVFKDLLGYTYPNIYKSPKEGVCDTQDGRREYCDPAQHLFLWATLLNRIQLAKMLWKLTDDHIAAAIVGAAVMRALANKSNHEEGIDITASYLENSLKFEALANGILDCCWSSDRQYTSDMLVRKAPNWGHRTVLSMAYNADMEEFVAETACYTKLHKIWRGDIALRTSIYRIVLFAFFPLAVFLIKFVRKRDSDRRMDERQMEFIHDSEDFMAPAEYNPEKPKYKPVILVTLLGRSENEISFPIAIYRGLKSPVVKSIHYSIFFLMFLIIYALFLMTELRHGYIAGANLTDTSDKCSTCCLGLSTPTIGCLEIITYICAFANLLEEIRQILFRDARKMVHLKRKFIDWSKDFWNRVDIISYILFVVAICIRFTVAEEDFEYARWLYCFSLTVYFIRFTQLFFVIEQLGPKIIMIKKMMVDLFFFIIILVMTMLTFGVISMSIINPESPLAWSLINQVFYKPYFQMYGELFLEDFGEGHRWILLAFYMILTNILLLNLLIAMFSYTFQQVQDKAAILWRYNYYTVVYEHFDRPYLPLFGPVYQMLHRLCTRFCEKNSSHDSDFAQQLTEEENLRITKFVKLCMERYMANASKHSVKDDPVHKDSSASSAAKAGVKQIETLEKRMSNIESKLDKIIRLMPYQRRY